jgi:hypothetical protein
VLGAVAQACAHVAAAICAWSDRHHRKQQQESQQQQPLQQQQILPVVHSLLQVWSTLVQSWPGKPSLLLVNGHLAPTLPAVIKLASTLFACAWPDDKTSGDPTTSSSSSRSASMAACLQQVAAKQALETAASFAGYFGMQAVRGVSFANEMQQRLLLSGVACEELLRVLLTDMGLLCQQLHVGLKGRSPWAINVSNSSSSSGSSSTAGSRASKQQMVQVPPYHKHLLVALNIGCSEELTRSPLTPMAIDLMAPPVLLQLLT